MTSGGASAPEIRLVSLTKVYGDVRAVEDVDLDIEAGEFSSLLGPSGCGKTTTLRMIGGFESPTTGRIELQGRPVGGYRDPVEAAREKVAWILEHHHPEPLDEAQAAELDRILRSAEKEFT